MRRVIEECDVCGKELSVTENKYQFKKFVYDQDFFNFQCWDKYEMCENCFKKFQEFVKKPAKKVRLNESNK